ncbi:MAG: hypothetical protein M1828_007656 [Chrysothrix sp. TS-e1954]|nr:MAG: hypothetical protein M1828_007656 [Chrysothrix sp. TS-e1954]
MCPRKPSQIITPSTAHTTSTSTSTSKPNPSPTTHPTPRRPLSILFVCLGNICRSPMAEGVFLSLLPPSTPPPTTPPKHTFTRIDSAGTGAYHANSPPDPRTTAVLERHEISDYSHAARKVTYEDFRSFDWIFAMDEENLEDLVEMREALERRGKGRSRGGKRDESDGAETDDQQKPLARVMLYGAFGGRSKDEEVVDPYYGGGKGFDIAFEQMQRFGKGFLQYLDEHQEDTT